MKLVRRLLDRDDAPPVAIVDPRFRTVATPLSRQDLAPLAPECETVQFSSLLPDRDFQRLADLLERHPSVRLRAFGGYDGSIRDLEFLRFFPRLRRFEATSLRYREFAGLDGLRHLPEDVVDLAIGQFRRPTSLAPLRRFEALERLFIEGPTKDIDLVAGLSRLDDLTLRSVRIGSLDRLRPLERLRSLDLKLGSVDSLDELPVLPRLRYLELWRVRGITDLSAITRNPTIQWLYLQDLAQVASLPDLSPMTELRRVTIVNLKQLDDLAPLAAAPNLEELQIWESKTLPPTALAALNGHPTLATVSLGLGSKRRNAAVEDAIGLPSTPGGGRFEFREHD